MPLRCWGDAVFSLESLLFTREFAMHLPTQHGSEPSDQAGANVMAFPKPHLGAERADSGRGGLRYFRRLHDGLDVGPILAELDAHPELWNENRERKDRPGTAHAAMDDIWLRYFPRQGLRSDADFNGEGRCSFYPAWDKLPSLQRVVWALMASLQATEMGGHLVTRLPPGGRILPHVDSGWHPTFFETKIYVPLRSNARCVNRVMDEEVVFRAGEIWQFSNLVEHEVQNLGTSDRITAILCFHCAR